MLRLSTLSVHAGEVHDELELTFDQRTKSRLRVRLASGREAALVLERGLVLRGGDRLLSDDGELVSVRAAPESLSVVRSGDPRKLARAAYHLGNRHVQLEVGEGLLSYLHDHVLDDMVRGLGLEVIVERRAFEPEAGAYGRQSGHGHAHAHADSGTHGHDHAPVHAHGEGHGHRHDHEP